jgi:hypothetical protein
VRSQERNPGYRGWDVWKELSGTDEISTRHGLTNHEIESIRRPPKTGEMRDREVGGDHSTEDDEDNKTSSEGRVSTLTMLSMKEVSGDCESYKHFI